MFSSLPQKYLMPNLLHSSIKDVLFSVVPVTIIISSMFFTFFNLEIINSRIDLPQIFFKILQGSLVDFRRACTKMWVTNRYNSYKRLIKIRTNLIQFPYTNFIKSTDSP